MVARFATAGPVSHGASTPKPNPLENIRTQYLPVFVHVVYGGGMRNGFTDTYRVPPCADRRLVMPDQTWDTAALQRDFTVRGFAAPYVVVVRKSDGVTGTLQFTHAPRVYFDFVAD